MGLEQQAPLTAETRPIRGEFEGAKGGGQGSSRGSTCEIAGMPKMMNFAEPMEIVNQAEGHVFHSEQVPARRIYTDGRDWPADEPPTLGGYFHRPNGSIRTATDV